MYMENKTFFLFEGFDLNTIKLGNKYNVDMK